MAYRQNNKLKTWLIILTCFVGILVIGAIYLTILYAGEIADDTKKALEQNKQEQNQTQQPSEETNEPETTLLVKYNCLANISTAEIL